MNTKTRKIVFSALFASLVCVATMIIKIPWQNGYINLGDSIVILSGFVLGPYGILAAAVGSCLADVFFGYLVYAPVTFVIKGLMAYIVYKFSAKAVIGAIIAEIIMAVGYYVFEGFLYGFVASLVSIPGNLIQGIAGFVVGMLLIDVFKKSKITF